MNRLSLVKFYSTVNVANELGVLY